MKRTDYLSWDAYFMGVALLSAQRSKDNHTQVGACIVNAENKVVSVGYNGMPTGCNDDMMPWERDGGFLDTKYAYVCHAELNAILNRNAASLQGCRLYVSLFPCNECAKAIIQSGIREVIYLDNKYVPAGRGDLSGISAHAKRDYAFSLNTIGKEQSDFAGCHRLVFQELRIQSAYKNDETTCIPCRTAAGCRLFFCKICYR